MRRVACGRVYPGVVNWLVDEFLELTYRRLGWTGGGFISSWAVATDATHAPACEDRMREKRRHCAADGRSAVSPLPETVKKPSLAWTNGGNPAVTRGLFAAYARACGGLRLWN